MKTVIFLIIILFISCDGHEIPPTIVWKSHRTFGGNKMPQGICRYGYRVMSNGKMIEFDDSCNKYEIGSIINFPPDNFK